MSTKARKRKEKRPKGGSLNGATPKKLPRQTKKDLTNPGTGTKARNWTALKHRYMAYEFLTYTEMAKATGIHENQIGKRAATGKYQPETWKEERTRKTNEIAEAQHERQKAGAALLNAKLRIQIQATADLLEAKGQQSLLQADGKMMITPREAITALAESARIKQAIVNQTERRPGQDGEKDEEMPDTGETGVVVVPEKLAGEAWQRQQEQRKRS